MNGKKRKRKEPKEKEYNIYKYIFNKYIINNIYIYILILNNEWIFQEFNYIALVTTS